MKNISTSVKIHLGIIAVFVLIKLLFLAFPVEFRAKGQEMAFSWQLVLMISLMGLAGIWLARRTGFPDIWDERVSSRQRLLIPAIVGLIYGLVTVVPKLVNQFGRLHPHALTTDIHVDFPYSIPFYTYGAIFLEIFLKLFLLTLIVFIISNLIGRGKFQKLAFWVAAILVSLYEPLPYILEDLQGKSGADAMMAVLTNLFGPLFISNIISAYLFRKYGFLAPLTMRLTHYLIWHIIYGGLT